MISLTKNNELKGYKSLDVYPEVAHFVTMSRWYKANS